MVNRRYADDVSIMNVLADIRDNRALCCFTDFASQNLTANEKMDIGLEAILNGGALSAGSDSIGGTADMNDTNVNGNHFGVQPNGACTKASANPRIEFRCQFTTSAANHIQAAGISNGQVSALSPTTVNHAMVMVDGTGNVTFSTRDGSTSETTDLDTWANLDSNHTYAVYTEDAGVTWKCEVDGVVRATHSTNVPVVTVDQWPHMGVRNYNSGSGQERLEDCDYFIATSDRAA